MCCGFSWHLSILKKKGIKVLSGKLQKSPLRHNFIILNTSGKTGREEVPEDMWWKVKHESYDLTKLSL